jgi:hypothetical protein
MTDGHSKMVGAATVFVVSDIAKSVERLYSHFSIWKAGILCMFVS